MQQRKQRTYREKATAAGMLLHGAALECYGKWGDDFSDMFNHFVAHGSAANNSCPREITANYWRRRISVCLQTGVANAINTRTNGLAAQTPTGPQATQGESFYPGLIEEQAEAFRDGSRIAWGDEEDDGG